MVALARFSLSSLLRKVSNSDSQGEEPPPWKVICFKFNPVRIIHLEKRNVNKCSQFLHLLKITANSQQLIFGSLIIVILNTIH